MFYYPHPSPSPLPFLQGVVKVGAVDVYQHKALGDQYHVRDFPTIMIFGDDKKAPQEYTGVWS